MSPLPPLLKRAQSKDKGIAGKKAEKHAAKRLDTSARVGSGAVDGLKGDFTVGDFLTENKTSSGEARTMSLKQEWLHKVYQEAMAVNRYPALALQFVNDNGESKEKRDRWVMVPEHIFKQMVGG